jgi:hypothetical protein
VAKVIAIGPGGKAQAPTRDDRYRTVIETVIGAGLMNRPLLSPPCKTRDEADDVRRGLHRSAFYYCSCGATYCTRKHSNVKGGCPNDGQRVGCTAKIVKGPDGVLCVQYRVFDKQEAMRYVIQQYGPDPETWPYFAKRKKLV